MRVILLFILCISAAIASPQSDKTPAIKWTDTTRDVYVDNELDRAAQVLTSDSPSRIALLSAMLESAVVLDVAAHTVSSISKDAFKFAADRASATSQAEMKAVGKFTRLDGPIYFFVADKKPVLIRAHPGATGEMTVDKLWETVPIWRSLMNDYKPNSKAVESIKAADKDTVVTIALGTWCPDSKNYVPKLIKALNAANNVKIQSKFVGVDNQFREPVTVVQPRRITNVPTVIVERDGREIGRIVETPAAGTMEEDLAAILGGQQLVHGGRWEHGPLLASGAYSYRDRSGKEVGKETWVLFSTAEGGHLVHSRISTGELTTEVFYRLDAKRRPSFAEVTKVHLGERTRTRFNIDAKTMTARMRGSVSGVVSQTLEVPERFFLSLPAIATQGFEQSAEADRYQSSSYLAPQEFESAMGTLAPVSCQASGEDTLRVPAGEFRAQHVTRKTEKEMSEWWLHTRLGVPVKGQRAGLEFLLTSLKLGSNQ